jgi:hypothetical protein
MVHPDISESMPCPDSLEGEAVSTSFPSGNGAHAHREPAILHPKIYNKRLFWYMLVSVMIFVLLLAQYLRTMAMQVIGSQVDKAAPKELSRDPQPTKGCISKTLSAGELQGYTGWARPKNTLAGSFQSHQCATQAVAGENWTCSIHCSHDECLNGGSLFFTRAYGPSIIPGLVTDHRNGTYGVTFMPLDEGSYTVEIVLTFSHHTDWETPHFEKPPENLKNYEGYLLPGFPVSVAVLGADSIGASCHEKPLRSCNMSELVETSSISAMNTGRWLVKEKIMDPSYNATLRSENLNKKYEAGLQSVGFTMDYVPTTCSLMAAEDLMKAETLESCFQRGRRKSTRPLEIVMVGDSNFRMQVNDHLKHYFGKTLKIHYIGTGGFFEKIVEQRLTELNKLAKKPKKDYVLLFNIGLHEFMNCEGVTSCPQQYREHLNTLATAVQNFPALLKVWQTTPAAWPKVRWVFVDPRFCTR